ncbi:Peptidase C13, legumain [Candidatus Magnetomorum sp. HK-1]|nr:Peptidase C13, legumain [Candidatus Magnetomorum sp. HK-1]
MEQFLKRGLLEKNITFLLNDDLASNNTCPLTKAEGVLYKGANKASIKEAITDWAKNKMNDSPANLYLVFVDHGSTDSFVLDTDIDNNLKASDLALWIEILETSLSPQASQMEIITLLGFCHSGSFIDNLSRKDKKRIIITSAAANEESFKGPKDIIRDGSFFMSSFFKWVGDGESIKKSFEKAVQQTEIYTSSDFISYTSNYPFFDNALQHPFLDDNGDGIGSNDLSVIGSDGDLSEKVFIGVNASMNHTDISIIETTKTLFLNPDTNTAQELYAIIENFSNIIQIFREED